MFTFDTSRPIYLQLIEEFELLIANGTWKSGQKIDSVRNLAQEYGVNPNTVQRALQELERKGLCESYRTKGRYVTADKKTIAKLGRSAFYEVTDELIQVARDLEIEKEEVIEQIELRWKETENEPNRD